MALSPRLITFAMSFLTLGIFWVGQQTKLNSLTGSSRDYTWIQIASLCSIATMPFSTNLLAEFIGYRVALIVYWLNIVVPGVMLYAGFGYALQAGLVRDDVPPEVPAAICRRIVIAQSLYAFGALLCVFSTYFSIAFIRARAALLRDRHADSPMTIESSRCPRISTTVNTARSSS